MNGNIEVESTKGKESTFLITIPLLSPTEKTTRTSTEFNLSNTNANILIIENNELNQLLIKQLLKPISGNKDFAYTAEDALKKIYTNSYDIIIPDIQLPGMSGLEITHHIHKNTPLFNTPIIIITADVSKELNESIKKSTTVK